MLHASVRLRGEKRTGATVNARGSELQQTTTLRVSGGVWCAADQEGCRVQPAVRGYGVVVGFGATLDP
jgi:hypothetical protein